MEAAAQDLLAAAMDVDGVVESEAKEHQGSSMHGSLEKGEGGGGVAADPEMSNLPTTSASKETKNRQSVAAGAACGGAEEDSGTTGSSGYLDVVVVPKQRKRNCDSLAASDSAASLGGGGGGEGEEEAAAAVSQQQHVLCRLCKRGFSSGAALRGHYLRAHGGGSPSAAAMEDGNARTSNSENGGDKEQQFSSWTTGRGTYLVKNPVASHIHSTGSDLDSCRDDESSPSLASSRPPPPPPPPRGARVSCSRSEAGRLTKKKKKRREVAAAQAESSSPMYQEQQEDEEDMEAEEDQEEEEATSVLLGSSSSQATNNMQEVDMEEVTEGTSYMCQICEEEFETAKELNLHKNEHPQYILRMNPKRSQRFIDQDCSDLVGGAAAAAGPTHHHHHHHHNHQSKKAAPVSSGKSEDKLISCTECNKKFGSMKALFGHMRCHPERYWRGIQPPDRSTLAQDHAAAAAAVAHTHHGSYRRKKRSPPIVLPKADPESESEMNSKQADAAGKASEVDDSDTESIEAAYINGSSSGRHNNCGPAGGWRTKKRTKRVRQMVRSLQAVAGSAAAAGAPQEEEEESPSTPPTEDTQVQKDIVFALMLLHPQRIAQLNPPFLEHKLSKDKDPLMDNNVPEKFKGKDNENAGCHETEKHHHHHYREADSKVKKMQQAEVAGGGEDGVVVSNNNQDLDELETQGEQGGGTRMMYQCTTCKRIFKSHQALGGHRASHKKVKGCFARTSINDEEGSGRQDQSPEDDENKEGISPDEDFVKVEQNLPLEPQDRSHISVEDVEPCDYLVAAKGDNEEMLNAARKTKGHECSICHRVFNSGQALGGHKRCHWGGAATAGCNEATTTTHNINNKNAMVMATVEQLGLQGFHPIQGLQSVPEKKGIMLEGILDLNMPAPECTEEMVEEQVASASGIMAPVSQHSYLPFPTFAIDSAVSINNQHPFSDLVVKGTKHMKFQGESLVNQVEKNLEPVASGTSDTVGFRTGDKTKDQEMNHFSSICDRSFTSLEHLSTHQKPHAAIMGPVPGLTV